jgi:GGDEF domain-containing protein
MPAAEGARFAEAIIQRVTGEPYLFDRGRPAEIGISIGYACCPEDGTALDELQGKADTALYEVKATRRGIQRRFTA